VSHSGESSAGERGGGEGAACFSLLTPHPSPHAMLVRMR
jgi:hypothetical protein